MPGSTFTLRLPSHVRQWLDNESRARGLPKTTIVQLLLEAAMRGTNAKP